MALVLSMRVGEELVIVDRQDGNKPIMTINQASHVRLRIEASERYGIYRKKLIEEGIQDGRKTSNPGAASKHERLDME